MGHDLVRNPQRQASSPPKTSVVRRPVLHPEFHLRNVVTAGRIVLVWHGSDREPFDNSRQPTRFRRCPCNNAGLIVTRISPALAAANRVSAPSARLSDPMPIPSPR